VVRDQFATRPDTEGIADGPRGGETSRFVGWESAIAAHLWAQRGPEQLPLL